MRDSVSLPKRERLAEYPDAAARTAAKVDDPVGSRRRPDVVPSVTLGADGFWSTVGTAALNNRRHDFLVPGGGSDSTPTVELATSWKPRPANAMRP